MSVAVLPPPGFHDDTKLTQNALYEIRKDCELFRLNNGRHPASIDDLVHPPKGKPLLTHAPDDVWGTPIVIRLDDAGRPRVISAGPDEAMGTDDDLESNARHDGARAPMVH